MVVVERVADAELARRHDLDPALTAAHPQGLADGDRAAASALGGPARRVQKRHEGLGAAVHRGHLDALDLDVEVVDAEAGGGGHEVLDGLDAAAVVADRRRVVRVHDALRRRRDRGAVRADVEDDA
jgi:hypothetical protein